MLPDTSIDDVKKQRNAEYAKHINDPVLSSLKMEGIRLLFKALPITRCVTSQKIEDISDLFLLNRKCQYTDWCLTIKYNILNVKNALVKSAII
jgi:hypothetical protein